MIGQQIPSIGRAVHYVLHSGPARGEHRPATIVRVWGNQPDSLVNLVVIIDGSNDTGSNFDGQPLSIWSTAVSRTEPEDARPGTWHWPEFVDVHTVAEPAQAE